MIVLSPFRPVLTRAQPNILVDLAGCARITNFGLSRASHNFDSIRNASDYKPHTTRWSAPEILNGQGGFSKESDVFSFAMVMIEVRHERDIPAVLWFTTVATHHRYSPARSRSIIASLPWLWWRL